MQSNAAVSTVNIPKPRRLWSWTYKINKEAESRIRQGSTPNAKRRSNWTRKHTRTRGKRETGLLVETKHMASFRRQRRESLRTRLSTWLMKITSFSLNNFAPEEFFGGAKCVSMNAPKFSNATALYICYSPALVGPYWEKLCPRSRVRPEAAGRGPYSRQRAQFFPIRTDQGWWITYI